MKALMRLEQRIEGRSSAPVGLDISPRSVRMVIGSHEKGGFTVRQARSIALSGPQIGEAERVEAIRLCLQGSGLKNPMAVCAVSGPQVVLSRFEFGPLPLQAIRQAVELEARQICPFDFEQSVLDYQLTSGPAHDGSAGGRSTRGFSVMVPRVMVDEQVERLKRAGGRAVYLDLSGLGALNCLVYCRRPAPDQMLILLDLGSDFTHVLVRGSDGIPLVRCLSSGGQTLLDQIALGTHRSADEARRALLGAEPSDSAFEAGLRTAAGKWMADIKETLRYALMQNPGASLSRIDLCGDWALSASLLSLLKESLPAAVEVFNPFTDLSLGEAVQEDDELIQAGPVFATAAGLAMRTIE
jgi:type IV pilus assembly protein PilM